ncbi:hypothetical protein BCR44DRAFT_1040594 [Catenaria anguillulae PL171]|uniref:Uncharacterized protein n=1 Tax=Catenaria anguillulae PL171 TaxID=765915 RepID=A0A1Y2H742_9FUNG|nr:hypothetical protein BCR44DRAFT_1040594 [Catenaria anguillulae PL171]
MDNNHNRQAERHAARLAAVLAQRERVQRQLLLLDRIIHLVMAIAQIAARAAMMALAVAQRAAEAALYHPQYIGPMHMFGHADRRRREQPFNIEEHDDFWCINHLRFHREFVIRMAQELFDYPRQDRLFFRTGAEGAERTRSFPTMDCLCIVLYRLARPERVIDMEMVFPYTQPEISRIFNLV